MTNPSLPSSSSPRRRTFTTKLRLATLAVGILSLLTVWRGQRRAVESVLEAEGRDGGGLWLPEKQRPPAAIPGVGVTTLRGRGGGNATAPSESRRDRSSPSSALSSPRRMPPHRPTTPTTRGRNRVYCMVPFIWTPRALDAYYAIHDTWGKRCDVLKFFVDPIVGDGDVGYYNMTEAPDVVAAAERANLTLPPDAVVLHDMRRPWHTCGVSDPNELRVKNCRNIWEKIWRAWVWVASSDDAHSAEWFVKVDADTYLFPDNLRRHVDAEGWSHEDHHYFGHVLKNRASDRAVSIVAGAAVFFSRATMIAAAGVFGSMPTDRGHEEERGECGDAYTATEEVVTAVCLKNHLNITAEEALDDVGREKVSLAEVSDVLTWNRTDQGEWWYWEGKKRFPCHDDLDCMSYLPIAFHDYKDSSVFRDLEKEFYGSVAKAEDDKNLVEGQFGQVASRHWKNFRHTVNYFELVRKAMAAAEAKERALSSKEEEEPGNGAVVNIAPSKDRLSGKNRLYCMVPFIWTKKYIAQYTAIHDTWGKRCDVLKFMIDPIVGDAESGYQDLREAGTNVELPEDVVVIEDMQRPWHTCDGKENCRNIWEKIWRAWIWVASHDDINSAEWFVKVDADTYLFPDNAKRYVKQKGWSHMEQHYFGHILLHTKIPIIAGAAVFFSQATLHAAASVFRKFPKRKGRNHYSRMLCEDAHTSAEEVLTAVCLKQHFNLDAQAALDDAGREFVSVGEVEDVLVWDRKQQGEWWYWKNKPKTNPETGAALHTCCADFPIALHGYKDPKWFYKMENELNDIDDLGEETHRWKNLQWRNAKETNSYFDRVRAARNASTA